MMAGRGLMLLMCVLAIGLLGGDLAVAQEQEEKPEAEESNQGTEEQQQEPKESDYTEAVTVTATRVETDLMKTPVAVTAFDQETLDREGVQNVRDLAQMVPNMDIATINGQSTPIISLRGVRSTNETELGDPAVGVHLDGVYSPRMQGALGLMFDNERVEVLRGPQGTLFGRNSTVGTINIISAKPKLDTFESRLNFQYGNYNAPEFQGMVNKPLTDTVAVRFAGRYHQRDSYIDGYWDPNQYDQRLIGHLVEDAQVIAPGTNECTSAECYTRTQHSNWWSDNANGGYEIRALVPADDDDFYMDAKEWAYRGSLLWQPKYKDMSLNLSFQHYRSNGSGGIDLVNCEKLRGRPTYEFDEEGNATKIGTNDCSNLFPQDDTYQAVVNTPGKLYLDIMYLRAQFNWDINDRLRFTYIGGAEDQDRESAQDMEQSLNAWDQAMFFLPGTGSRSWMDEVQFQSYGNKHFNWIAGLNFFYEKTSTIGYFDNPIDPKSLWDQPDRSTTAGAVFGQGTYSYSDKWHLTIGYRYSDETKEDKGGRSYNCTTGNGCAPEVGRENIDVGLNGFAREDVNDLPPNFFADPAVYPEFQSNDNKGSWSHSDWRVALDYQKNEDTLLYGYLATGFKAGGIGDVFREINPKTGEEINIRTAYGPEEVTTLELGFKKWFADRKLALRGAYFYSDYEDMQYASVGAIAFTERWQALRDENGDLIVDEFGNFVFGWVPAPIIAYFTQNVPGAEIMGFELEYDSRPWNGGRLHGYASWLDTEVTEDWVTKWNYDPVSYFGLDYAAANDAANPVLQTNMKGNELAVSPPFKIHMTIDHSFLLERQKIAIVPWVTAHWEDESYLTIWNVDKHTDDLDFVIFDEDIRYTDDRREAWSMFHAGVRMHAGDWMAELYAYNITDEVVQYWGGAAEQVPKGSMSVPRNYGFRIGYQF